jgi:hypothetical protein
LRKPGATGLARARHPLVQVVWQQRLERLTQETRQGRSFPIGRQRQRDARALHNRSRVCTRALDIVDSVDEEAARFRRLRDGAIHLRRSSRDDVPGALDVGRFEGSLLDVDLGRQGRNGLDDCRRDQRDPGSGVEERTQLPRRDRPAANDEHAPTLELQKRGKNRHPTSGSLQNRAKKQKPGGRQAFRALGLFR